MAVCSSSLHGIGGMEDIEIFEAFSDSLLFRIYAFFVSARRFTLPSLLLSCNISFQVFLLMYLDTFFKKGHPLQARLFVGVLLLPER